MKTKSILFGLLVMVTMAGSSCKKDNPCPERKEQHKPVRRPDVVNGPVKVTNPQP